MGLACPGGLTLSAGQRRSASSMAASGALSGYEVLVSELIVTHPGRTAVLSAITCRKAVT